MQSKPVVPIGSPTWSPQVEQSLLGAALLDSTAIDRASSTGLVAEHFFDRRHGLIWSSMLELAKQGEAFDVVSVYQLLQSRGQDDDVGGLQYLNEMAQSVPSAHAAATYAGLLVEQARRRRVEAVGLALQQTATGPLIGEALQSKTTALLRELGDLITPKSQAPRIPVEWAADLPTELHAPRQIVEGVLLAGGMSMMYGESNSGKSYLAIHLAICVSLGLPWLGKRTQRGAVLYVAAEGAWSIRVRLAAYRKHFDRSAGAFGLIPSTLSLVDPSADVEALVELVRAKTAEMGEPILLIVVDTVARVLGGGDENAAQDMGRLVSAGDYIRQETGAHLLYIHHSGKDAARGARGHSSLRAALDTEIEVSADAATKVHTAKITKQRDLPSNGEQLAGRFVPVELGFDQWGGSITACAVVDAEVAQGASGQRRLTPAQQAVLAFLAGRDAGVRRLVIVEALTQQGIARPSVYRGINDLVSSGLACIVAGLVYAAK